jgi:coenzyme Q-binding protein COQ10
VAADPSPLFSVIVSFPVRHALPGIITVVHISAVYKQDTIGLRERTTFRLSRGTDIFALQQSVVHLPKKFFASSVARFSVFTMVFGLGRSVAAPSTPFHTRRLLQFSQQQVYDVVSQVQHYKHFVPFCVDSIIVSSNDKHVEADLKVQYMMFSEKYRSKVDLVPPSKVSAQSNNTNLFEYLNSSWTLTGAGPNSCWVDFKLEYKFRSSLYETVAKQYFDNVAKSTVNAFENRCKLIYKKM